MPEENHLVIGLGGTGCSVVRELHKQLFVEWKNRRQNAGNNQATGASNRPDVYEFAQQAGQDNWRTRVATLSIDSNEIGLLGSCDQWRVLGEQITLSDTERSLLSTSGIKHMLNHMDLYPGVKPWLAPDRDLFEECLHEPGLAHQVPRIGRLVLAQPQNLQNVLAKVRMRLSGLCAQSENHVTIHLSATLGGGIVSGVLVDMIAQIRKILDEMARGSRLYLYLFITAEHVIADSGNFHANQYGALQELNALIRNAYQPWDISDVSESVRLRVNNAYESCFLLSGISDSGQYFSLSDQVRSVTEVFFQMFTRLVGGWRFSTLLDHLVEDLAPFPEDTKENSSGRSTRFASFGIKRLGIPEEEIRRKLALAFARQGVLALIYNHWDDQKGYLAESRPHSDVLKLIASSPWAWKLDPVSLGLDQLTGYLPFARDWQEISDSAQAEILAMAADYRFWIELYRSKMEEHYQRNFRGMGVNPFFDRKSEPNTLAEHAHEIVNGIERSLLEDWLGGSDQHGTDHLPTIVAATLRLLIQKRRDLEERQHFVRMEIDEQVGHLESIEDEFRSKGRIAVLLGKHKHIFCAYTDAARRYYTLLTDKRALQYTVDLISKVLPELERLHHRVRMADALFKRMVEGWEEEADKLLVEWGGRGAPASTNDFVRYVNAGEVTTSCHTLLIDTVAADSNVLALRFVLHEERAQRHDFGFITTSLSREPGNGKVTGHLLNQMERASSWVSQETHAAHELNPAFHPVLGVNIVKKLHDDYGGLVSEKLEADLAQIVAQVTPLLAFDYRAQQPEHGPASPIQTCCVLVPQCASIHGSPFREQLCAALRRMRGNPAREIEIYDLPEECGISEIAFLSTAHFFPLRLAKPVADLSRRFGAALQTDPRRTLFRHFGENHQPPLPGLMIKSNYEQRNQATC
jgi:hypothetical protein